jgi:hypothetical protein
MIRWWFQAKAGLPSAPKAFIQRCVVSTRHSQVEAVPSLPS